jgi:hypothetical protein
MSEPKFYRRKLRPLKSDNSVEDTIIPFDLLFEAKKRRIEMMERESIARRIITLSKRTRLKIRVKLFLIRLWKKIRKQ